jgi:hypothetical protein
VSVAAGVWRGISATMRLNAFFLRDGFLDTLELAPAWL